MSDKRGGSTPEQYEETSSSANPPAATAGPASVVAGMWYYLAPIAVLVAVVLLALFYWPDSPSGPDENELTAPTTGTQDEATPGGVNPDPQLDTPEEERDFRGGDDLRP